MAVTSGTTGWQTVNNNLSEKLDWEFVNFNYYNGTVTIECTPYIGNRTSGDISYTISSSSDDYIVFNGQTVWIGGGSSGDTVYLPAGYEGKISATRNQTFTIPSDGDMSNCTIGIRRVINGVTYNTTSSVSLPNFSSIFIKKSSAWKRATIWGKINGTWKRCILWKKISGVWKKGD